MTGFGARIMTGGVLAVIGLIAIKVVIAVLTGALALAGFLLFTVLPILLVGWIIVKLFKHFSKNGDSPAFD